MGLEIAGTIVEIAGGAKQKSNWKIGDKICALLGGGAKIFTIAGPVIVYGTFASVVHGLIYWITTLF